MIHSTRNIIYLLLSLLACTACSDETLIHGPEEEVEEGVPVTATFSFSASDPAKIETKATDIDESNKVNSLAIFIFKQKKDGSFERDADPKICDKTEIESKQIKIATTSGHRYVYAIANYKSSLYEIDENFLENIQSIDDLKNLSVTMPENADGSSISVLDGVFLMSGCVVANNSTKIDFDTPCTIRTDSTVNGRILLQRVMSSIQFKVMNITDNATFVADSWQVKNVPQSSYVFERTSEPYGVFKGDFKNSKVSSVFEKKDTAVNNLNTSSYNFSFLMMENRKTASNEITSYDMREKMDEQTENFSNAPENSTYVVLKGTFTGQTNGTIGPDDKPNKNVTAYTTYYIHLGNWNREKGGDYADFNIFRNTRYIYTVKVVGVDKIIVEVESNLPKDESWGSDGEMYVTSGKLEFFDAHYGTTVISFSKQMIKELIEKYGNAVGRECDENLFIHNFPIVGTSPKGKFLPSSDIKDLDWVTYKRNPVGEKGFVKYKENEQDAPLNVDGFKADLFNACQNNEGFDENDSIRYTCFIDEYFYGDDNGNYPGNRDSGLKLTDFVNQQPRTINILTYYKSNGESASNSFINMSTYAFVQRPIYTIYDLDKVEEESVNGWGAESIQETDNLKSKAIPDNLQSKAISDNYYSNWKNDFDQGRTNMHKWIAKMDYEGDETWNWRWDKYIDPTNNELKDEYNYAQYACLAKNRDLNGNGIIDNNELRWYLPAVNQYTAFVIGSDVLPEDVRLYRQTDKDIASGHIYVSSTVNANPTLDTRDDPNTLDYYVLLANEGLSINFKKNNKNSYRCVRNLKSVTDPIQDIVSKKAKEPYHIDGVYKSYSFENLNPRAKRDNVNGALTFGHTNIDEENRLPESFEVGPPPPLNAFTDYTPYRANWKNPCTDKGDGWRLPNQKELAIFVFHKQDGGQLIGPTYLSCTRNAFEIKDGKETYCGYFGDPVGIQSMTIWPDSPKYEYADPFNGSTLQIPFAIRCVRDKKITNK